MRGVTFSEFKDGQNVDMFYNAPDCKPGTPMQEAIRTAKEIRQNIAKTFMYGVIIVYNTCIHNLLCRHLKWQVLNLLPLFQY